MSSRTKLTNEQIQAGATAGTLLASGTSGTAVWVTFPLKITREIPTGDINGVNTDFALSSFPELGSEEVFLNGILQNESSNDYTIAGVTLTFEQAPLTNFTLLVSYNTGQYTFPGPVLDGGVI